MLTEIVEIIFITRDTFKTMKLQGQLKLSNGYQIYLYVKTRNSKKISVLVYKYIGWNDRSSRILFVKLWLKKHSKLVFFSEIHSQSNDFYAKTDIFVSFIATHDIGNTSCSYEQSRTRNPAHFIFECCLFAMYGDIHFIHTPTGMYFNTNIYFGMTTGFPVCGCNFRWIWHRQIYQIKVSYCIHLILWMQCETKAIPRLIVRWRVRAILNAHQSTWWHDSTMCHEVMRAWGSSTRRRPLSLQIHNHRPGPGICAVHIKFSLDEAPLADLWLNPTAILWSLVFRLQLGITLYPTVIFWAYAYLKSLYLEVE